MVTISTHVLDTSSGKPAEGVTIQLEYMTENWTHLFTGITNHDGRIPDFLKNVTLKPGLYRMRFDIDGYFGDTPHFYPYAEIVFSITDAEQHYHVPLLLSPFGYSTYRGS